MECAEVNARMRSVDEMRGSECTEAMPGWNGKSLVSGAAWRNGSGSEVIARLGGSLPSLWRPGGGFCACKAPVGSVEGSA